MSISFNSAQFFVRNLYPLLLSRAANDGEEKGWVDALVREELDYRGVFDGFINSIEYQAILAAEQEAILAAERELILKELANRQRARQTFLFQEALRALDRAPE